MAADTPQPLSFQDFLERMKDPAAADLVRNIKKRVQRQRFSFPWLLVSGGTTLTTSCACHPAASSSSLRTGQKATLSTQTLTAPEYRSAMLIVLCRHSTHVHTISRCRICRDGKASPDHYLLMQLCFGPAGVFG